MRFLISVLIVAMMLMCALLLGACSSTPQKTMKIAPVIGASARASNAGVADATAAQPYIVQLSAAPLASYAGDLPGLAATNPAVTGARSLDLNSPASRAYLAYLKAQQEKFLASLDAALGCTVTPSFVYFYAMNGMTVKLTAAEAAQVAKLPDVISVRRDMARPLLDTSPQSHPPH